MALRRSAALLAIAALLLAADGPSATHCRPRRHRLTATAYRQTRDARFAACLASTHPPSAPRHLS